MERLRPRMQGDQGFSLIELLVVVIILGVLAAIAIPVYLNQRNQAIDSTVQSDLRNAATFQVAYLSEHGEYVDPVELLESDGWRHNAEVTFSAVVYDTNEWFCLEAFHAGASDRVWTFDTVTGAFFMYPSTGNCPVSTP